MLTQSCETLHGVGPTLAMKLAKCGIFTIQDLLFHLPFRYQDRTRITAICDLRPNDWCVISGEICKVEIKRGRRPMLYCHVADKTGILKLRFFHFYQNQVAALTTKKRIRAFGEVRVLTHQFEMIHPEYQLLDDEQITPVEETLTPIYPSTEGLSQTRLRQLIKIALLNVQDTLQELEWLPQQRLQHYGFPALSTAIQQLHFPPPHISIQALENGTHPGLRRVVFDELVAQMMSMQFAKQERLALQAPVLSSSAPLLKQLLTALPFQLTVAQKRVAEEIQNDLQQSKPMLRLVQGDVGSGKTVIAALAAVQAIAQGYQVAFMAPTDLLSEQHAQTLTSWLASFNLTVLRLSGKMKATARRETLGALAEHQCDLVIGTHALFQENVSFAKLGLVIIDEQHRFGVAQRLQLHQKGQYQTQVPHQLLMTATPIPRTLAMTQLAHLDLSIIDELPPGRSPIVTVVLSQEKRQPIIERLQQALAEGRQAYWVCTLIDESEVLQCQAATATAEHLQQQLTGARIGLVHGRMNMKQKEETMLAFKTGDIQLLVATTVIEVGVDVPNASLMIIENAERLGLSQLHQLRGRIGRGRIQSHCLLLYQAPLSPTSAERLRVMRTTADGFIIAEKDLQLRGAGEILGTRQTGYRQYKIANLQRDHALLPAVTTAANHLLKEDARTAQNLVKRWLGAHMESFLQS